MPPLLAADGGGIPRNGLDLGLFATPDRLGGALRAGHEFSSRFALFGEGWAGAERGGRGDWRTGYGARAGLRFRW